jgi:hypothetical protein
MMERAFTPSDQLAFASLAGDHNPIHLDALAARRLLFGRTIVHGVDAFLWVLDAWLAGRDRPTGLRRVSCSFQTALGVDEVVRCEFQARDDGSLEAQVTGDGVVAHRYHAEAGPAWAGPAAPLPVSPAAAPACRERSMAEVAGGVGTLELYLDAHLALRLFPGVARLLPPQQIAVLLATSRLVGMECPGLRSVLAGLDLWFEPASGAGPPETGLRYRVRSCDARFSLVLMDVEGPGVRGTVKAFVIPGPQRQRALAELRGHVRPGEFAAQRALVVGGSRGLGELTAKLLAAGGADVRLTYHRGAEDAARVVQDIVGAGGTAACFPADVLAAAETLGPVLGGEWAPTHLYYFATPHYFATTAMSGRRRGGFGAQRFRRFCDHYVTGFFDLVQLLRQGPSDLRGALYPSTAALDELPAGMAEYAAAKAAGEAVCALLEKLHPRLRIHRPRLPRMATDQTASLMPVKVADAEAVMLEHLRYLEGLAREEMGDRP